MKSRAIQGLVSTAAALLITASWATSRADVVAPPESGVCPPGTEGGGSHGMNPAYCRPLSCTSNSDCTGGTVCGAMPLCADGDWIVAACPDGDECPSSNFPCTELRVCATEEQLEDASDGCSCRMSPAGSITLGGWLAAMGLSLLIARRRRNRTG